MSGNSSVFSSHSANRPNTTSATIATTVIIGRLIAKSEMTMPIYLCKLLVVAACRRDSHRSAGSDSLRRTDQHRVACLYS